MDKFSKAVSDKERTDKINAIITEVNRLISLVGDGIEVDLSDYYTKSQISNLLSQKANSTTLDQFKTSMTIPKIPKYEDVSDSKITASGSTLTFKSGCVFGNYEIGEDVDIVVTTAQQTKYLSTGYVTTMLTNNSRVPSTEGFYLIMYQISNSGRTVGMSFKLWDDSSDPNPYSDMGYVGHFYWDGTGINRVVYYTPNTMPYDTRNLFNNYFNLIDNLIRLQQNKADISHIHNYLEGVQINSNDLTIDNKKVNIPLAGTNTPGVAKANAAYGVYNNSGTLTISKATDAQISAKMSQYRPLTPYNIDLVVKIGITTNTNTLTNAEKINACNWLGALPDTTSIPENLSDLNDDLGTNPTHTHSQYLTSHQDISGKVDKVTGKGLSTNDYTTVEKNKLAGLSNYDDSSILSALDDKADVNHTHDTFNSLTLTNIFPLHLQPMSSVQRFADISANMENETSGVGIRFDLNNQKLKKKTTTPNGISITEEILDESNYENYACKTDLSNISASGKLVLDGQPVPKYMLGYSGTAVHTGLGIDLTEYLPDDNATYEVLVEINCASSNTTHVYAGDTPTPYVSRESDVFVFGGYTTSGSTQLHLTCWVPLINNPRTLYHSIAGSKASSSCSIVLRGYRRIGTNS